VRSTTKRRMVREISSSLGTDQATTKRIVQGVLDAIVESLVTEGRLELRNFGVFELRKRAPRVARNPRTNVQISLPGRTAVVFQPSKRLSDAVATLGTGALPRQPEFAQA
jgi:integration host factor subunit beta